MKKNIFYLCTIILLKILLDKYFTDEDSLEMPQFGWTQLEKKYICGCKYLPTLFHNVLIIRAPRIENWCKKLPNDVIICKTIYLPRYNMVYVT